MTGFTNATSVVTGAASGLGRCFAVELGRRRGRVVIADVDESGLEQTASLVREAGGEAHAVRCDVRSVEEIRALADETESWAGAPSLAVLNAGILVAGPLVESDAAAIERLVGVNLLGVLHGCRIFGARMAEHGRGSLLNVASLAGLLPVPLMSAYAATKAGVVGLSESLHAELRPAGVAVTALCPSFTRTAIVHNARASSHASTIDIGHRIVDRIGAEPERVIEVGLAAAAAGRLYAVDTLHGRVAWRVKRAAPRLAARLAALASARLR